MLQRDKKLYGDTSIRYRKSSGWLARNSISIILFFSLLGLLGVKQYGCHLSAYYRSDSEYYMWIGRRSPQKQTFPGMLDNTVWYIT